MKNTSAMKEHSPAAAEGSSASGPGTAAAAYCVLCVSCECNLCNLMVKRACGDSTGPFFQVCKSKTAASSFSQWHLSRTSIHHTLAKFSRQGTHRPPRPRCPAATERRHRHPFKPTCPKATIQTLQGVHERCLPPSSPSMPRSPLSVATGTPVISARRRRRCDTYHAGDRCLVNRSAVIVVALGLKAWCGSPSAAAGGRMQGDANKG